MTRRALPGSPSQPTEWTAGPPPEPSMPRALRSPSSHADVRPRHARSLALALLLAGAGGCAVLEPEARVLERRELAEAEARGAAQGLRSYEFVYAVQCTCSVELTQPSVVMVQEGEVEAVRYVRGGEPSAISTSYWPTVE